MNANNQENNLLRFKGKSSWNGTKPEQRSVSHEILKTPKKFSFRYLTCLMLGHDWKTLITRIGPTGYPTRAVLKECKRCKMSIENVEHTVITQRIG